MKIKLYKIPLLFVKGIGYFIYLIACLWCFGAIWYSNLPEQWVRSIFAWCFALTALGLMFFFHVRARIFVPVAIGLLFSALFWWWSIPASNEGNWQAQFAKMPKAIFHGNLVTIENFRDFEYRSENDFKPRYITQTYDLRNIRTVDLASCYWGGNRAISHTMLSFGFADGRHVVVSAETRLKKGDSQTGIKGLFKQYNSIFVLGSEADIFKLRTNYRHEQLYLYPTNSPVTEVRALFIYTLKRCNRLRRHPQFYNTITHNCMTSLLPIFYKVKAPKDTFDIRIYLNGFSDEMAFENGWLKRKPGITFSDYKSKHLTNLYVEHLKETPNYSQIIRPKGIF